MSGIVNLQIPPTTTGFGAVNNIADVIKKFSPTRILVVTDKGIIKAGIIDSVTSPLEKGGYKFDIYDSCELEPSISSVENLAHIIRAEKYDLLVGIGGGSAMDSAKVASIIAANEETTVYDLIDLKPVDKAINKIMIPTTAGTGAEWSSNSVVTDDKNDRMGKLVRAIQNLPDAVILDPDLTLNLPPKITGDTGMDALTHAIEAYTSAKASIFSDILAGNAIKLIAENLRPAFTEGKKNPQARYNMAVAASLAMHAVVVASAGIDHYMQKPLDRIAHISHGSACTILLPYVMEFNMQADPVKFAMLAGLMGEDISGLSASDAATSSVEAVRRLVRDLGMPQKMSDMGITETDIPSMVEEVQLTPERMMNETNPRKVTAEDIKQIFTSAL
ncbi:iron-containing alcohol dehydrogenase [Chloroflexota bacterium]